MLITHTNWAAIIVAAIASVIWGWIWHTWICEKKWFGACGLHSSMNKKDCRVATVISFVAALLTAYVINRLLNLAQNAHLLSQTACASRYGFAIAFTVWIGFYVPMAMHITAWMHKQWNFFVAKIINNFIHLIIISMIIACWTKMS